MVVEFTMTTLVAGVPPKETLVVLAVVNSVPVIVAAVPPAMGPSEGVTLVMVGGL